MNCILLLDLFANMNPLISSQVNSELFFSNYGEYMELNIITIYMNNKSTNLSLSLKNVKVTNKIRNFDVSYDDDETILVLTKECNSNLSYNDRFEFVKNELCNILNNKLIDKNEMFGIIYTSNGNLTCYKNTGANILKLLY